jgi:superfamily I DNA and/or RNA helicase
MFEISNVTTYDGLMVHSKNSDESKLTPSQWIDVQSTSSSGHWIENEGLEAYNLVKELIEFGNIDNNQIYLISPFRDVVKGLKNTFKENNLIDAINKIGTIHTVQGKEAKVIILVLGSDPESNGARAWASSKPNLLNVAVTRAKDRLYIIGNKSLWKKQNYFSDAIKLLA